VLTASFIGLGEERSRRSVAGVECSLMVMVVEIGMREGKTVGHRFDGGRGEDEAGLQFYSTQEWNGD
jgi:hypothetical protein